MFNIHTINDHGLDPMTYLSNFINTYSINTYYLVTIIIIIKLHSLIIVAVAITFYQIIYVEQSLFAHENVSTPPTFREGRNI
jgi:hypothetical protein